MSLLRSCAAAALLSTLAACAALTSPSIQAGDLYGPAAGESEFTFGGSVTQANSTLKTSEIAGAAAAPDVDFKVTSYDGQIGYGYYLTDNHEVGGQAIVNLVEQDFSAEIMVPGFGSQPVDIKLKTGQYGLYPYYRYNFRANNRMQYYVGVQAGFQQVDFLIDSTNAFSYGAHVGFKSWITPSVSFFVEPRLTFTNVTFDFPADDTEPASEIEQDIMELRTLFGFTFSF